MTKIAFGPRSGMNWISLSMTEMPCPFTRSVMDMVRTWAEEHMAAEDPELVRDLEPEEVTVDATHARTNGKPVPVGRHRGN